MRVIFAGHTGLEKAVVVNNLVSAIYERPGLQKASATRRERFLKVFEIEKVVEQQVKTSHVELLETANLGYAYEQWSLAFDTIMHEIEQRDPDHVFLLMHLTSHVPGRSVTPYLIEQLGNFRPTHIVTLIDDIYEVQARIERANVERSLEYHISLRELAWWRAEEIGRAAWLVRNLPPSPRERGIDPTPVEHFVVAVKHPVEMLFRLLFGSNRPIIYASFPITATRDAEECRREIDRVRNRLHSLHIVFDPLTIDELSPNVLSDAERNPSGSVLLEEGDWRVRWHLPETGTLSAGRRPVYPITLEARQVQEVKADVEHSIRVRDFGLVDGCDYVVGYRPYYRGIFSKGMFAEFNHAHNVCRPPIPIHYYWNANEDTGGPGPFDQFRTRHMDETKFWSVVERLRPRRSRG